MKKKPKVFIGSSVEGLNIAYAVQENLQFVAEVTVWDQGVFNLSDTSIESLMSMIENIDFGVFVFTPDDIAIIRGKKNLTVRDNVLFELGLFFGKIGRQRSFIILPDNVDFHLPTDLLGITPGKYETTRSDGNLKAATGSISNKIRDSINRLGFIIEPELQTETLTQDETKSEEQTDNWAEELFDKKNYAKAISLLKNKIRYEKDIDQKVQYRSYSCYALWKMEKSKGLSAFQMLITEYPKNNIGYKFYAQALMEDNNLAEAYKVIESGLSASERKIGLTSLKADCLWNTDKKQEAIALLNNFAEKTDAMIITQLAKYHSYYKDFNASIAVLKEGYRSNPKDTEILKEFARSSFEIKNYDLSIYLFSELLSINENNQYALCMIGNCYYHKEFHNSALNAYEKANEIAKEEEGWILDNIGNLYSTKGLYSKAEHFLTKSNKINNKSDYTLNRLSGIYKSISEEKEKIAKVIEATKAQLLNEIQVIA